MARKHKKERYSFTKLSCFCNCKYGYLQRYIENKAGIGNCFSSFGTFVHSILERYARGELELWDLPDVYDWEFDTAVAEEFPTGFRGDMRKLYYDQGLDFLNNFSDYDGIKILEVESEFDCDIDDWTFNGIIDLAFEDCAGKLVLRDYKSKSGFKSRVEQAEYARQLYLYCIYIKEKYGKFPDALQFFMFRKNKIIEIPFNIEAYHEAMDWARRTVTEIRECWDFCPSCEPFFGNNLCNHRKTCDHLISEDEAA